MTPPEENGPSLAHRGGATRQKSESNMGRSASWRCRSQPTLNVCPECGSERVWKDGLRYTRHGQIQRWLCRRCGFRFSKSTAQLQVNVDVVGEIAEVSNPAGDHVENSILLASPAFKHTLDDVSLFRRENVRSHGSSDKSSSAEPLNRLWFCNSNCRVGATRSGAKNLAKVKTQQEKAAGATKKDQATIKGKIVEFAWYVQKQGYKSAKNRVSMIKRLVDLGADLWNPETVKEILAKQTEWKDSYKMLMVYAYENFLAMEGLTWQKPRYKQQETLPFIPTEQELDQLITGVGKRMGTFLQGLKDTGADPGELAKLRWIDVNGENNTVNITPVKGHAPRILKVSDEFIRRLGTLPKKSEYIFSKRSLYSTFYDARRNMVRKLNNPRLKAVHFTTFRHWKGTMEYHKTKDILHVKQLLGHRNIQNTMVYINLETAIFNDRNDNNFHVKVAETTEEACELVKVGFQFIHEHQGKMIFRKRR